MAEMTFVNICTTFFRRVILAHGKMPKPGYYNFYIDTESDFSCQNFPLCRFSYEDTCALLEAIERVTCSTPSGARLCSRCGMATPARPPAVDDLIMGAFGAPTAEAGAAGAEESSMPRCQCCSPGSLRVGSPCRALAYADAALLAARPIKMGELVRSAYAKQLVNQHKVILRSKVLRMHQWGISLPGACEGLCH